MKFCMYSLLINAYRSVCWNSFCFFCSVEIRNKTSVFFKHAKTKTSYIFLYICRFRKKNKKILADTFVALLSAHAAITLEIKMHKSLLPPKMKEVYVLIFGNWKSFKNDEKTFYFNLKNFFVLKIFKFEKT